MKKKIALTLILIGLSILLMAFMPDNENYPTLGGEWLLNEETGEWWYMHSNEEFDMDMEGCNQCHTGLDAFYNKIWICPWKEYDA